jgi:hypothetical protein
MSHYLVSFYGPLTDDARGGLSAAGLAVDGQTGGGTVAPGGELPPMNRTYVRVEAASGSTAIGPVQAAVAGRGAYGEFQAQPL